MKRTVVAIRHVAFEDLGTLHPLLEERGYDLEYIDAGIGTIDPSVLAGPDLVIILGGPIGAYDHEFYPFLSPEITALRARLSLNRPTLGICLGAQLMALALGGDVHAAAQVEIGYAPISISGAGGILTPISGVNVLHWHGDKFTLPAGATSLASTVINRHQAFSLGNALGLQFHLEADHTQIERWLIGHSHELATRAIDARILRAEAHAYGPALASAARATFAGWFDRIENQHQGATDYPIS
jgi:GMP synthase (glutamine-hydrolysing)